MFYNSHEICTVSAMSRVVDYFPIRETNRRIQIPCIENAVEKKNYNISI